MFRITAQYHMCLVLYALRLSRQSGVTVYRAREHIIASSLPCPISQSLCNVSLYTAYSTILYYILEYYDVILISNPSGPDFKSITLDY